MATATKQVELFCTRALPKFIEAKAAGMSDVEAATVSLRAVCDRDVEILNWMYSSQRFENAVKDALAPVVWHRIRNS